MRTQHTFTIYITHVFVLVRIVATWRFYYSYLISRHTSIQFLLNRYQLLPRLNHNPNPSLTKHCSVDCRSRDRLHLLCQSQLYIAVHGDDSDSLCRYRAGRAASIVGLPSRMPGLSYIVDTPSKHDVYFPFVCFRFNMHCSRSRMLSALCCDS